MSKVLSKQWAAAGCLTLVLAWAAASPAAAQGTPQQRAACEGDAYRLCGQFIPDEKTTAACLRRHRMGLSPGCRALFSGKGTRSQARQR
jgi:hypothetical protein